MSEPEKRSAFEVLTKFKAEKHGDQFVMDCPFCEKHNKFHYNEKFLWDCKTCSKSGNLITFLREIYDLFDTMTQATAMIADLRGLPTDPVRKAAIKINRFTGEYLIPTFKNDKLNNLYRGCTDRETGKLFIMATPDVGHTLMHWNDDSKDTLWICEGHWDYIAALAIIGNEDITPESVPGCGTWKAGWNETIAGKDIVFCYDNDQAGVVGYENVIMKHIHGSQFQPKSISYIDWEGKPEGYDLNDCYREHGRGSFLELKKRIKPFIAPEGMVVVKTTIDNIPADMSCDTFDKLLDKFKEVYHVTPDMEIALALVLCSIYSNVIEGEQLWFRLIGPPGSGKTSIVKTVSGSSRVVMQSTFTGLLSGWTDDNPADAGLIPLIAGKTLVVKDADALMSQGNIGEIFSQLRDFYDKDTSITYRNRRAYDYKNVRSTMILCGTNVLRRKDKVFLGERFLDCELRVSQEDRRMMTRKVIARSMMVGASESQIPPEFEVMAAAKGFIEHLITRKMETTVGIRAQKNIENLGFIASQLRAQVDRTGYGDNDVTFEPTVEVPTRISGQLVKLCQCLPVIYGLNSVDDRVFKGLYKVINDVIDPTCPRMKICAVLANGWASRKEIMEFTELGEKRCTREMDDLRLLDIVDVEKFKSVHIAGAHVHKFKLKSDISEGLKLLGIGNG